MPITYNMPLMSDVLDKVKKRQQANSPGAGKLLEQLTQQKLFKPGREEYWRYMQKQGMTSQQIVDEIYKDEKSLKMNIVDKPGGVNGTQQKAEMESDYSKSLLDSLFGQLGQQAEPINQGLQTAFEMSGNQPIMTQPSGPQVQPGYNLPSQEQNLLGMLQKTMNQPGFSLGNNPVESLRRYLPSVFNAPKPVDPVKQKELELREMFINSLNKGKETTAQREKRLSQEGQQKHEMRVEELGLKKERLSLDNQKYLLELEKMDKSNDYQSIKAINDLAKLISPDGEITDEIFGQAIEKLKTFNPRFNDLHNRAVKKATGWFGRKTDRPTLKKPEEIVEPKKDELDNLLFGED